MRGPWGSRVTNTMYQILLEIFAELTIVLTNAEWVGDLTVVTVTDHHEDAKFYVSKTIPTIT